MKRSRAVLLITGAALISLAGCSGTGTGTTAATSASVTAPAPSVAAGLTLVDGWAKAAPTGMTGVFGTLHNGTDKTITITGGTSQIAARVETHEVAMVDGAMKMRPKEGGFTIAAGADHVLAPGRDHLMLLGLTQAVKAGETIMVDLTLADGSKISVSAIGKDFAAGNESYQPSPMPSESVQSPRSATP